MYTLNTKFFAIFSALLSACSSALSASDISSELSNYSHVIRKQYDSEIIELYLHLDRMENMIFQQSKSILRPYLVKSDGTRFSVNQLAGVSEADNIWDKLLSKNSIKEIYGLISKYQKNLFQRSKDGNLELVFDSDNLELFRKLKETNTFLFLPFGEHPDLSILMGCGPIHIEMYGRQIYIPEYSTEDKLMLSIFGIIMKLVP